MTGSVRIVTDETFADVVLGSALPCLVEFRDRDADPDPSDWLSSIAVSRDDLTCARLDVSSSPRTARTYDVTTVPAYLWFRLGAVVSTGTPLQDLPDLGSSPVAEERS